MATKKIKINIPVKSDGEKKSPTEKTEKKCTVCGETKALSEFYKRGGKCKECTKTNQRERNKQDKEERLEMETNSKQLDTIKKCKKCGIEKTLNDFRPKRAMCKDCEREYGRNYNKEHKDKRRAWHENNYARHSELNANNYQKHKNEINDTLKFRYHNDTCYQIHKRSQASLQYIIRRIREGTYEKGTRYDTFACWFEYNFTEEMNWDNYGKYWDIDHVVPVSKWNLEDEEQLELCSDWKNLMPLECCANKHKKAKLTQEQLLEHRKRLRKYYKKMEMNDDERKTYFSRVLEIISHDQGETPCCGKPLRAPTTKSE